MRLQLPSRRRARRDWLADHEVPSGAERSWLSYEPLGVVFAVMPWNFPFWQVLRFACAALSAGNAAVLKHSPNVTGCALALEQLFADAGAPDGLFSSLVVAESQVAELSARIIADPRVAAVTITGSERAGSTVAAAAGRALKKSVLELGGSDPFVVLDDADLEAAAAAAVRSRFGNAGQSCIAAKRLIVSEPVADRFVDLLTSKVDALESGIQPPPTPSWVRWPALTSATPCNARSTEPQSGRSAGRGRATDRRPWLLLPADGARPGAPGNGSVCGGDLRTGGDGRPGAGRRPCRRAGERHGLRPGGGRLERVGPGSGGRAPDPVRRLVPQCRVASDPRLPFGGIGRSGYGRELSAEGTREFTNVRTVYVGIREMTPAACHRRACDAAASITSASMSPTSRPWSPGTPRRWT